MLSIIVAYNSTLEMLFRLLDWSKGRPYAQLEEARIVLEDDSRVAQIKGDVYELQRIRAKIEEIDRDMLSIRPSNSKRM